MIGMAGCTRPEADMHTYVMLRGFLLRWGAETRRSDRPHKLTVANLPATPGIDSMRQVLPCADVKSSAQVFRHERNTIFVP